MQSRMTALLLRKLHYYSSDVLSLDNPRTSITKKVPALELLSSLVVSLFFSPIKLHINNLFKEVFIKRNKKINIEPKWLLSIIIGSLLKDFFSYTISCSWSIYPQRTDTEFMEVCIIFKIPIVLISSYLLAHLKIKREIQILLINKWLATRVTSFRDIFSLDYNEIEYKLFV